MKKRNLPLMFVFITILLSYISTTGLALDLPLSIEDPQDDVIKFTFPLSSEYVSVDYIDIIEFSIVEKDEDNATVRIDFKDFTDFSNISLILLSGVIGEYNFSLEDLGVIFGQSVNDSSLFQFKVARMDINGTSNDVDWDVLIQPIGGFPSYNFSISFNETINYIEFDVSIDDLPDSSNNYLITSFDLFLSIEELLPENESEWIEFIEEFGGDFSFDNITDLSLYFDYLSDIVIPIITPLIIPPLDYTILIVAIIVILSIVAIYVVFSSRKRAKNITKLICNNYLEIGDIEKYNECLKNYKK